ncbi:MAG: UvrD-helicase domain-containing protein [Rhodocyclaceae bacterium]
MSDSRLSIGLDPARSVVVEACAGSGKTWLLVSRLVRLLIAGVPPKHILAITYTRKAAREIEERLRQFLGELATLPDEAAIDFLRQRGLSGDEAVAALPRARVALENVLHADPPITITTFHGWFARLLSGAPLESGLAGLTLDENTRPLLAEAWARLASDCGAAPESAVAQSLLWLYGRIGAYQTNVLLDAFVERRAEWQAWCVACGSPDDAVVATLASFGDGTPPTRDFVASIWVKEARALAAGVAANGKRGAEAAAKLEQGIALCAEADAHEQAFEVIREAVLTGKNEPRALTVVKALATTLGEDGVDRLLRQHADFCAAVTHVLGQLEDQRNRELNEHALRVGVALLEAFTRIKRLRRVIDFTDLECEVDRLLAHEEYGAFLQARLDARYRQILLDEFQDTNPMQWRILQAWLSAYGADAQRPSVFLVGDPKQSIYRFRRAEPRLFEAAARFFQDHYGAVRIRNDHTRRNAQPVIDAVNAVFTDAAAFEGFQPQTAERTQWPGRVDALPLVHVTEDEAAAGGDTRNPLLEAVQASEDLRRADEARQIVDWLGTLVGHRLILGKDGRPRTARYGDVMILTRRTTILGPLTSTLREAGIPFTSPGRGGLLLTLEAADLLALMDFLADPADNLAFAHVLRTPAFDVDDDVLLRIAADRPALWWQAARRMAREEPDGTLAAMVSELSTWIEAARHLPAHDLLDRIFHRAHWFERYRARVPAALWPGVRANLEALLELTLSVDAGRYPSLSRLRDELRRLSDSRDGDAPSEGLIQPSDEGDGRLRIMTVHAAKGLEAPIVLLLDAHARSTPPAGYGVALDWPAEASIPAHFSLLGRYSERGLARQALFEADEAAAAREELNLLYVAMTRAEQVFAVSGIAPAKGDLAQSHYLRVQAAVAGRPAMALPEAPAALPRPETPAVPPRQATAPRAVGSARVAGSDSAAQSFGRALHAYLESATQARPLPVLEPAHRDTVPTAAQAILAKPGLRRFFDPAQYVRAANELAFMTRAGALGRIDRWVDTGDSLWILDYKSGKLAGAPLAQYRAQLVEYRDIIAALFAGREVRCLLVFTDGSEWELDID